jgi:hypothetical protein
MLAVPWNVFSATGPCYDPDRFWRGTEPVLKVLQLPWDKQAIGGPTASRNDVRRGRLTCVCV